MVDAPVLQGRDGGVDDRRRGRDPLLPTPSATQGEDVSLILVTGSRDYARADYVAAVLDRALAAARARGQDFVVLQGGCGVDADDADRPGVDEQIRGADGLAHKWGRAHGVPVRTTYAAFRRLGPSAGPRRNAVMVHDVQRWIYGDGDGAAYVVAFPEGSKGWPDRGGTADCVRQARRAGLRVGIVGPDGLVTWGR